MTALTLRMAYLNWRMIHEAIHGTLSRAEEEVENELVQFLQDVAKAEDRERVTA